MKVVLAQVIGAQWDDYEGIWYAVATGLVGSRCVI